MIYRCPTWWPFIMAFRYAIGRTRAIHDIEDWLLCNLDTIDQKEEYLNQMVQGSAQAIIDDCYHLQYGKTTVICKGDIEQKRNFMERVLWLMESNNIELQSFTKSELARAQDALKEAEIND